MRVLISTLFISLLCCQLQAQVGIQRQWLNDPLLNLAVQPAALADTSMPGFSIQGNGSASLVGNAGLLDLYFENDGFLDDGEKQIILDRMGAENTFQYNDAIGPFLIAGKLGKIPFSLSFERNRAFGIGFNNPQSLELLLRGNAIFAGQTVSDNFQYHRLQTDKFGLGTAFRLGKASVGIKANYVSGSNMTSMDNFNFSVFTAEDGSMLSLASEYVLNEATDKGQGFGLDLGLTAPLGKKMELQLAVMDLGFMNWDVNVMDNNGSIDFSGINLNSLVNGEFTDIRLEDTLRQGIFPDTVSGTFSHMLPTRASVGVSYSLKKGSTMFLQLAAALGPFAPGGGAPAVSLGYQRSWSWLTIGGQAFGGGIEGWGVGAIAAMHLHTKRGFHLDLVGELQNGMSLISKNNGGLRGQVGLAVGF